MKKYLVVKISILLLILYTAFFVYDFSKFKYKYDYENALNDYADSYLYSNIDSAFVQYGDISHVYFIDLNFDNVPDDYCCRYDVDLSKKSNYKNIDDNFVSIFQDKNGEVTLIKLWIFKDDKDKFSLYIGTNGKTPICLTNNSPLKDFNKRYGKNYFFKIKNDLESFKRIFPNCSEFSGLDKIEFINK